MMAVYLTLNGYEVIEATNGVEALELALAYKPDIILMDLAMPMLDGIDATKAIREHEELLHTPILCLTAFGDLYAERAKAAGCDEVLPKPVDFGVLDSLLQEHLQQKESA